MTSTSPYKRALLSLRRWPMYWIFIVSYTVVHLHFERNFWVMGEAAIFAKYAGGDLLEVGQRVYYAKATWCFVMIWLLALRLHFKTALALSFGLYAVELMLFFPPRIYSGLNVLLAAGMLIEVAIRRPGKGATLEPSGP